MVFPRKLPRSIFELKKNSFLGPDRPVSLCLFFSNRLCSSFSFPSLSLHLISVTFSVPRVPTTPTRHGVRRGLAKWLSFVCVCPANRDPLEFFYESFLRFSPYMGGQRLNR